MKKIIHIITGIVLGLCLSTPVGAQTGSHLSVGGGLGMSGHQYRLDNSLTGNSRSNGLGYHFGAGYSYFFHPNWGIGTAVYMSRYKTTGRFDNYEISFENRIDDENDNYTLIVDLDNWREQQKSWSAEIPLLVYYQRRLGERKRHGIYAAAGAKVQFNVDPRFEVTDGTDARSGYYPEWNVLLYGLPQHGFGTDEWLPSGGLSLKTSYAATGQLGAMFGLTDRIDLLVGAYLDYGLNDIKESSGNNLVSLDAAGEPAYTNMIASNQTGRTNLLSVGGTVTLRFRLCGRQSDPLQDTQPVFIIPEVNPPAKLEPEPTTELPPALPAPDTPLIVVPPLHPPVSDEPDKFHVRIYYQFRKADLSTEAETVLNSVATVMLAHPEMRVVIESHTCNIGSKEVNLRLSALRNNAALNYLISKGISRNRFTTESKYYLEPLMPNDTPEHRAMNRRSEIFMEEE